MRNSSGRIRAVSMVCLAVGILALRTGLAASQKAKGSPKGDTPVTSTLNAGFITSDNGNDYLDVNGVSSIIQTSNTCCNDWILDTAGSARSIDVNFSQPLQGGTGPSGLVPGRIIVQCHLADGVAAFPGIPEGGSVSCPMVVSFPGSARNTVWRVAFGGPYYANLSNTDLALVTCNASSGGQCDDWSIASTGSSTGDLSLFSNTGKLLKNEGNFTMPFSFHVKK